MLRALWDFCKKYDRARRIAKYRRAIPPYLQKDFEVELNYKLWTTKGARFAASHRTETLQRLSSQCVGYLSAYLIIVGLVNVYGLKFWMITLTDNQVNFSSVSLSVLILLFSQLESSESFVLKSDRYHNCALDIAELYNELRYNKTYENTNPQKGKILHDIGDKYDKILKRYENHRPIDYKKFQMTKPDYFRLSLVTRVVIRTEYYWKVHFKYHLFMFGPLVAFLLLNLKKMVYGVNDQIEH
ncbi:SLATT domain-containing protein [Pedobacter kyonggii]|uniref:SLATT domain-containing protein n=1 Tax=Pedobacter kyonggii TaxID=1926871 RepID=A0A4Q9HAV0_9SPHI|nr:SLATT domain-containing protein [Pedobacter kyonggii]TBO41195.1 SLATT domain-containing protein [Pedobacter kyonggii]